MSEKGLKKGPIYFFDDVHNSTAVNRKTLTYMYLHGGVPFVKI